MELVGTYSFNSMSHASLSQKALFQIKKYSLLPILIAIFVFKSFHLNLCNVTISME